MDRATDENRRGHEQQAEHLVAPVDPLLFSSPRLLGSCSCTA